MKQRPYKWIILVLLWASLIGVAPAKDTEAIARENKVKAAFLYNFLKFVEWPEAKATENKETIILSVIGETSFGKAFDVMAQKPVNKKKLVVKYYPNYTKLYPEQKKAITQSHLLYIAYSEKEHIQKVLDLVREHHVLTVSDTNKFLEKGGHINFVVTKKVNFEINLTSAKEAGLNLRAQLLKVAKRVHEDKKKTDAITHPKIQREIVITKPKARRKLV